MGLPSSAVIPIACLSAIVGVSLVFVIWWFPRTWARGNAEEAQIMQQQINVRDAQMAELEAQRAVNRPHDEEMGSGPPSEAADAKPPTYVVQPPKGYVAPVTMY